MKAVLRSGWRLSGVAVRDGEFVAGQGWQGITLWWPDEQVHHRGLTESWASSLMKTFRVLLRGREDEYFDADRYRREADQYVFETDGETEVRFVLADEVVGIVELPPDEPEQNFARPYY